MKNAVHDFSQNFHNNFRATGCYWLLQLKEKKVKNSFNSGFKLELETTYHLGFVMKVLWT